MPATLEQYRAALAMTHALAEAICALGSVPSGDLYARVMGHMDVQTYDGIITTLKNVRLVKEEGHLLTWIGPQVKES